MRFDAMLPIGDFEQTALFAERAESTGFDGVWTAEAAHDAFLPLMLAAEHTERVVLGTGIAIAFARTPMTMAVAANDLHRYSHGRCILGLGSQIRPHIENRYSMPWSRPAARMREFVLALRAIWASWNEGARLDFRGEFYKHTLMTPMFNPGPNPHGPPRVYVAGVGGRMTHVAGEVADGLIVHPFTTVRYLQERILPAFEDGLAASGRMRSDVEVCFPGLVVLGDDRPMRNQLAFYGSTPAYHPVLELHGWLDLGLELNRLSKSDRPDKWQAMGELITDEVVQEFAITDASDQRAAITQRFGGLVDRFTLPPASV
ncbi:MAG: TIGR03617 family F420-dependent LLM class oxidoreductase [Actinomycetes bacterium]